MSITEFLTARLDEDEAVAKRAASGGAHWAMRQEYGAWGVYSGPNEHGNWGYVTFDREGLSDSVDEDDGPHIARWDPARVLAEVEAKRRIVEEAWDDLVEEERYWAHEYGRTEPTRADLEFRGEAPRMLNLLALPYADHPDYDESWRP